MKFKNVLICLSIIALLSLSISSISYGKELDAGPIRPKTSPTNSYVYTNNF